MIIFSIHNGSKYTTHMIILNEQKGKQTTHMIMPTHMIILVNRMVNRLLTGLFSMQRKVKHDYSQYT